VAPFDEDEDDGFWSDENDEFVPDRPGPQIDIPEAPDISEIDGSDDVVRSFWVVAIMVNIGLLATSLGLMFIVFQSQLRFGGGIFAIGAFALLSGYRHYRNYKND
jgi:hypothetical protein